MVCMCRDCGATLHPPRKRCHICGSWRQRWQNVEGRGTLYSFTVVERTLNPAYPAPYTLLLVDIDEAPGMRLIGSLPGRADLEVGQSLELWFEVIDGGTLIPQWKVCADV